MYIETAKSRNEIHQGMGDSSHRFTVFQTTPQGQSIMTVSNPNVKKAIEVAVRNTVKDLMIALVEDNNLDEDTATLLAIEYSIDPVEVRKIMSLSKAS